MCLAWPYSGKTWVGVLVVLVMMEACLQSTTLGCCLRGNQRRYLARLSCLPRSLPARFNSGRSRSEERVDAPCLGMCLPVLGHSGKKEDRWGHQQRQQGETLLECQQHADPRRHHHHQNCHHHRHNHRQDLSIFINTIIVIIASWSSSISTPRDRTLTGHTYISERRGFRQARFIRMGSKPTPASNSKQRSYMLVEVTMKGLLP